LTKKNLERYDSESRFVLKSQAVIEVDNLKKYYSVKRGIFGRLGLQKELFIKAIDGISFKIFEKDILALVGESGCGKTTTGRLLSLLETPTAGSIFFKKKELSKLKGNMLKEFRRSMQMIFQDPYESLDPRFTILRSISEPLVINHVGSSKTERTQLVTEMLERVGLEPVKDFLYRYPNELSGGQRQRVSLARAMILYPAFVIADEPVSMLDVSIRASILNLMLRLREELNVTYLFITHDLAVARYMSTKIAVMYLGKIVEMGETEEIVSEPMHPYTQLLISAIPISDLSVKREKVSIESEPLDASNIPSGCRFHTRCSKSRKICSEIEPFLIDLGKGHHVACHTRTQQIDAKR